MTLSKEDLRLLREVLTWARANGWKRDKPKRRSDGRQLSGLIGWQRDAFSWVLLDLDGEGFGEIEAECEVGTEHERVVVQTRSVAVAVDALVTIGVLPATFSSAYRAARDELVEDIAKNVIQLTVDEYYGSAKARAGDPLSRKHKQGFLEGIEEATDGLCDVLGVAQPLWEDMREIAEGSHA